MVFQVHEAHIAKGLIESVCDFLCLAGVSRSESGKVNHGDLADLWGSCTGHVELEISRDRIHRWEIGESR